MPSKSVKLIVSGRVQGVSYRASTIAKAQELGIVGYVKNNADKTVTVIGVGQSDNLEQFIDWCGEGPGDAQVDFVDFTYNPPEASAQFTEFKIL